MAAFSSEERLIVFVMVGLALAAGALLWWQGQGPGARPEWENAAANPGDVATGGEADSGPTDSGAADSGEAIPGTDSSAAGEEPNTAPPAGLVVHVAGAVAHPGVYSLPGGSRVIDAVEAAGGATASADPDAVNLARPLTDGERLYIPTHKETSGQPTGAVWSGALASAAATGGAGAAWKAGTGAVAGGGAAPVAGGRVNLNTATEGELETLPGIGPTLAARIVAFRTLNGPFRSPEELMNVSGIGPKKYADLKDLVTIR